MKYILIFWVLQNDVPNAIIVRCDYPEGCVSQSMNYERWSYLPEQHLYRIEGKQVIEETIPPVNIMNE